MAANDTRSAVERSVSHRRGVKFRATQLTCQRIRRKTESNRAPIPISFEFTRLLPPTVNYPPPIILFIGVDFSYENSRPATRNAAPRFPREFFDLSLSLSLGVGSRLSINCQDDAITTGRRRVEAST